MDGVKSFVFGQEFSPNWFLNKVNSKDVEYIFAGKRVIACRFYDTHSNERVFAIGESITSDLLYKEGEKLK